MNVVAATLAGLLHDIGEFEQRGRAGRIAHTEAGGDFYVRCLAEKVSEVYGKDVAREVESAIRGHHDHTEVVTLADHIAAGERFSLDQEETNDPRETSLIPIWHGVRPEGSVLPPGPAPGMRLSLLSSGAEALFPCAAPTGRSLADDYARLWREFKAKVAGLPADAGLLDSLLDALEDATWCVPSAAYRSRADISLFDHLRLTAAVAACLAHFEQPTIEGIHFVLLLGDLSGIQTYLLALGRERTKGAAKRLRARSDTIARLSVRTAEEVLKQLGLYVPNLLVSAGGKFYLLLPATEATLDYLPRCQAMLDQRCARDFHGLLSVRLAWLSCSGRQLCDFGPLRQSLEGRVRLAKSRPLAGTLQQDGHWAEAAFILQPFGPGERPCPVCGVRPVPSAADEETVECEPCRGERERGARLAREGPHYVPQDPDGSATEFGTLADLASGRPYLGVLKADVDHLGRLFDQGLAVLDGEATSGRITLSRIMAASRSLDWFFTRWLRHFLRSQHPYTYTVYAGGDDLLLVGPWDRMIDLAEAMEDNFRDYVANNPRMTWSAGLAVCPAHTPIHIAVRAADRLLSEAKDEDPIGRPGGRNQVACLGTVLPWDRYVQALAVGRRLGIWVRDGVLSASMLQTLMWAGRQVQRFRARREAQALRWVPHLAYQISRLAEPKEQDRKAEWERAFNWLVALKEAGLRDLPEAQLTDLDALRFVADYAAYISWRNSNGKESAVR